MVLQISRAIMKLVGQTVSVEMKNGEVVSGTLKGCDLHMNLHLKIAKVIDKRGDVTLMDQYSVRGSTVRCIILPDTTNLDLLLQDTTTRPRATATAAAASSSRGRGGRGGRGGGRGPKRGRF